MKACVVRKLLRYPVDELITLLFLGQIGLVPSNLCTAYL